MKWKLSLFAVLVLVKFSVCFLFVFNMCFSSIIRHVHEGSLSAPNDTGTRKNSFNIEGSHSPNTKKPRQAWPKQKVTILTYLIRVVKKKLSPSCLHLTLFFLQPLNPIDKLLNNFTFHSPFCQEQVRTSLNTTKNSLKINYNVC